MNSVLNPEAPEFYPHLTSVTQSGYTTVNKSIRASNQMPLGTSYDLFKTFTEFNVVSSQISENVIIQSNQIVTLELPTVRLKRNDLKYNNEKIIDANDSMLDRININIDTVSGVNRPGDNFLEKKNDTNISSWNKAPVIAKIQMGSTMFIGAKNIPRPQLTFKDSIDNSESLWVPRISDKPNNIKPLALNIIYNDEGEAVGFEHPYKVELDLYHPPSEFVDPDLQPPSFPPSLEATKLTFIETEAQLDELVKHLSTVKELAVDVEHHSYRTYQGITCLLQISTDSGGDFIIDTLAAREHIHKLNLAFTDPKKLKVFHGADKDVLWLQRDFGVYIVGMFDTHQAAKVLQINGLSLKHLLMKYCQIDADKRYQLADWRIRPLPDELIEYARMDTHCLLYIWRQMKAELLAMGAGQPHYLLSVFENSRHICGLTYNKEVMREDSHMALYLRSKKCFNTQQMAALKLLYKWRDAQARLLDESTMYLLPNHMVLSLAESLPRELQGVTACCHPTPPFVKQNLVQLHRMLLSCRDLPSEPQPAGGAALADHHHYRRLQTVLVHDLATHTDELPIDLDQATVFVEEMKHYQPEIPVFDTKADAGLKANKVSVLNVDAKMFIPPYDRYRKYRSLAQIEELKEYKDKEAKIAALSKGDELIKKEVLEKLQKATAELEKQEKTNKMKSKEHKHNDDDVQIIDDEQKTDQSKRKRKIINDKSEQKDSQQQIKDSIDLTTLDSQDIERKNKSKKDVKPFVYKNVDYKKFYDYVEKPNKQPKTKFKKRKHC